MTLCRPTLAVLGLCAALLLGARPCSPDPATGWPTIHGDPRNSDTTALVGAADLAFAWEFDMGGKAAAVDPQGRLYATSQTASPCSLWALDGATGAMVWCSDELNEWAVASSPLIGASGNLYVGDDEAMHAFDRDGNLLWEVPIAGAPISAQFYWGGGLLFITHIGRIYMLNPANGALLAPVHELVPGAAHVPGSGLDGCFDGVGDCYSANTLAIDPETGDLYFTLSTPATSPDAEVRAMRYVTTPTPHYETLWTSAPLAGGSASSPAISLDRTRVYVNDNAGILFALDAATGAEIWQFDLGFVPKGSASLSEAGVIMPAGAAGQGVIAIEDLGSSAAVLWHRTTLRNRGIPVQVGGGLVYAVTVQTASINELDLTVLDADTGVTLDVSAFPGTPLLTIGTSVGPNGLVVAPGFQGGVFAFAPSQD